VWLHESCSPFASAVGSADPGPFLLPSVEGLAGRSPARLVSTCRTSRSVSGAEAGIKWRAGGLRTRAMTPPRCGNGRRAFVVQGVRLRQQPDDRRPKRPQPTSWCRHRHRRRGHCRNRRPRHRYPVGVVQIARASLLAAAGSGVRPGLDGDLCPRRNLGVPGVARCGRSRRRPVLALYAGNGILNAAWTAIFFRAHRPLLAGVEILALLATIVALIVLVRPFSRSAAVRWCPTGYGWPSRPL
jgi:hypothetical protein